jgi:tetratricopeptide (TPR) repeat protein
MPENKVDTLQGPYVTGTQLQARQYFEQAVTLERQADFQTALDECATAIRLDPGFADAHNLRGVILDSLEQKEEAIRAYHEAIRLDPAFKEAIENLRDIERELLEGKIKTLNSEGKKFGVRSGAYIIDAVTMMAANLAIQFGVGLTMIKD